MAASSISRATAMRVVAIVAALAVGVVGATVLFAWWLDFDPLKTGFGARGGGTALLVTVTIVLLGALILWSAASLDRVDARRRQASGELHDTEGRLFQILESLPVAIFVSDASGRPYYANQASQAILGKGIVPDAAPEELAQVYQAYVAGTDQPYPTDRLPLLRALSGERAHATDVEIHRPDRVVPLEVWAAPVFDSKGRVAWAVAAFSDTTERTRAEEELRASEARARSIVNTAYDAFVAIDANSVITEWNRQAEATFGWTRDEAIGRHLVDTIIPPQHREAHRRGLARFLATGEGPVLNRVIEITALRQSGEEFPVELTITPLRLGGTYRFNAFVRDITNRKRAEEELRQSREAAEAANRAKSEFLARMSHELRTPLNSIIGFSEVLEDQLFGPLNEKQRRHVGNIQTSGRHLLSLINDILDLSKVEAGHMVLVPSTFDIGSALREVRAIVSTLAERKRLALQVEVDRTLPPLTADQGKLRQILYNLLSNAIKFTPEGGRVCVTARRAPPSQESREWIEIAVADTGIGLKPEDGERLFREFAQLDSSGGEVGTGLGLALSRKLVELHGGRIWVESEIGKGCTFRFVLPLAPGRAAPSAPTQEEGPTVAAAAGALVLVAEDDEQSGYLLTHYLTEAGYRVVRASTGERTMALARELRPDAITLDILLSGADGLTTLAQLKASPETRDIPVLVVSVTENRELGLSLGATDWFVKPVNREQLVAAVRQAAGAVTKARP